MFFCLSTSQCVFVWWLLAYLRCYWWNQAELATRACGNDFAPSYEIFILSSLHNCVVKLWLKNKNKSIHALF